MPEGNFKTWGDANDYCEKYDASHLVAPVNKFELAEALLRAYRAGASEQQELLRSRPRLKSTLCAKADGM